MWNMINLPQVVLLHMLTYVGASGLWVMAKTCKKLRDQEFWKLYNSVHKVMPEPQKMVPDDRSWTPFYRPTSYLYTLVSYIHLQEKGWHTLLVPYVVECTPNAQENPVLNHPAVDKHIFTKNLDLNQNIQYLKFITKYGDVLNMMFYTTQYETYDDDDCDIFFSLAITSVNGSEAFVPMYCSMIESDDQTGMIFYAKTRHLLNIFGLLDNSWEDQDVREIEEVRKVLETITRLIAPFTNHSNELMAAWFYTYDRDLEGIHERCDEDRWLTRGPFENMRNASNHK